MTSTLAEASEVMAKLVSEGTSYRTYITTAKKTKAPTYIIEVL